MNNEFDKYYEATEPGYRERAIGWATAIGLQDVDGLKPSKYLISTAKRNIEGEITANEARQLVDAYYEVKDDHDIPENTEEAVSVTMAHRASMADGIVSADEVETVEKMFAEMGLSRTEHAMCVGNFILMQREGGDAKVLAGELASSFNHVACRFLYGLVLRVALADWRIADEEERFLKEVGGELGLSEDERAEFRQGNAPAFDGRALEAAGVPAAVARLGLARGGIKDAGLVNPGEGWRAH